MSVYARIVERMCDGQKSTTSATWGQTDIRSILQFLFIYFFNFYQSVVVYQFAAPPREFCQPPA